MQIGCDPKADSTVNLHGKENVETVLELVQEAEEMKKTVIEAFPDSEMAKECRKLAKTFDRWIACNQYLNLV